MVHYGGATEEEAHPHDHAESGMDHRRRRPVGSIDVGKDADLVIWNMDPLSTYARAEKVYIDGDLFFDSCCRASARLTSTE